MNIKIKKIIFFCLMSLPFLDALNGILVRQYNFSIGTIYHVMLTLLLITFTMICKCKIQKKYFYYFLSIIGLILISVIGNIVGGVQISEIGIEFLVKLLCTFINFLSLLILIENKVLPENFCDKVLEYTGIIIPVGIIISKITGIGNTAYIASERGFLGFYNSSNELNCILLILVYFNICKFYKSQKFRYVIYFFIEMICCFLIESKISMGLCMLALFLILIKALTNVRDKIKKSYLMLFILLIIALFFVLPSILPSVLDSFWDRQQMLITAYIEEGGSFINYFTSGRLTHGEAIFTANYTTLLENGDIYSLCLLIFRLIFGSGFYYCQEYFEMEFLDIFIWCGLIGEMLLLIASIYILRQSLKKQKSVFYCLSLIVTFICIAFSGHVLFGGVAGIYFSLICINTMKYAGHTNEVKRK